MTISVALTDESATTVVIHQMPDGRRYAVMASTSVGAYLTVIAPGFDDTCRAYLLALQAEIASALADFDKQKEIAS